MKSPQWHSLCLAVSVTPNKVNILFPPASWKLFYHWSCTPRNSVNRKLCGARVAWAWESRECLLQAANPWYLHRVHRDWVDMGTVVCVHALLLSCWDPWCCCQLNAVVFIYLFIKNFFSFIFISWRLITLQYCSGYGETDHQPRLGAWDKCLGLVHCEDPEGSGREGGGRGDRDGEYM